MEDLGKTEQFDVNRLLEIPIICSAIGLIWIKPIGYTIKSIGKFKKQWVYYWMALGVINWAETHLFPDFTTDHYVACYVFKALFCFLLGDPLNASLFDIRPLRFMTPTASEGKLKKINEGFDCDLFKRLLEDESPLKNYSVDMHPWATNPNRISSLVAARIGMLAVEKKLSNNDFGRIAKLGILEKLIEFLSSIDQAKLDNALLALVYLTEDKTIRTAALKEGVMPRAAELMRKNERLIVRLTAARLCRNVYFLRGEAQDRFFKEDLGGVIIELLEKADEVLYIEMTSNVLDFLMTREGKVNIMHNDYLKQNGLGEALKRLKQKYQNRETALEKTQFLEQTCF